MENKTKSTTVTLPVVALRGLVVFPDMRLHFDVGRNKSVAALRAAMTGDQEIFLVSQKDIVDDDPDFSGLNRIGVVATVKQVLKLQGSENVRVAVEGLYRARIAEIVAEKPYLQADIKRCPDVRFARSMRNTRSRSSARRKTIL
jgi:ATP-dependent Lon protease